MAKWVKGESGNPGGRPRVIGELRELARAKTVEAIETLSTIMTDPSASPAARVAAANALLDRGYGRPTASTDHEGTLIDMTATETGEYDDYDDDPLEVARRIAYILSNAKRADGTRIEPSADLKILLAQHGTFAEDAA